MSRLHLAAIALLVLSAPIAVFLPALVVAALAVVGYCWYMSRCGVSCRASSGRQCPPFRAGCRLGA